MGTAHLSPLLPAPAMTPWGPPQTAWPSYTPQATGPSTAPYNWCQGATATAAPVTPNIALTISEMLTQPQVCDSTVVIPAQVVLASAKVFC